MGTCPHAITLSGPRGSQTVEALVDTGATFSSFLTPMLEQLGTRPIDAVHVQLENGQVEDRRLGQLEATLEGVTLPSVCLFGPPDTQALIGAHALKAFLLAVDPVEQRLVPREGLLL